MCGIEVGMRRRRRPLLLTPGLAPFMCIWPRQPSAKQMRPSRSFPLDRREEWKAVRLRAKLINPVCLVTVARSVPRRR